jgi:subtilase family serine protease
MLGGSLVVAFALLAAVTGAAGHSALRVSASPLAVRPAVAKSAVAPLPTSTCLTLFGIHCYAPSQFARAYRLNDLFAAGIDGLGQTIAIVDSFGSPTIVNDLHQFDQQWGLADPNLTIIHPAGAPPPFDPNNADMVGWAQETTLDVEWAHVMAPKANILLVETPTSETEGVQGFPEIVQSENYVIDNHLAGVISQSFGATEETFPSNAAIMALRSANLNAAANGVTMLGSSGDAGPTDYMLNLEDLYPYQVNSWPSSDPLVTSIGGTQMNLDNAGNRLSPDAVWNDGFGAGGGGPSHVFSRPSFQDGVSGVVGAARGTPDVSLNAAVDGGVWVYYTFVNPASPWHIFGGTSAASPEFAGIVAMAEQVAGGSLGTINGALYKIPYGGGLVDVTIGDNSFAGVTGYDAVPGYDMASGLGTVDAARFVPALANGAGSRSANASCTGSMSFASVRGNLDVPRGAACSLTDSVVSGVVTVEGSLTTNGSTIGGSVQDLGGGPVSLGQDSAGEPTIVKGTVQIMNQPAGPPNQFCGSEIDGNLQLQGNHAQSRIGATGPCAAGNSIGGSVMLMSNTVSGAPAAVILGNTVKLNLMCSGNSLPPTGSGNTVGGVKQAQCAGF